MVPPFVNMTEGTSERFLGDGFMVLFNDSGPCPDPEVRAVRLAIDPREGFGSAVAVFGRPDESLGLGIGIAQEMATMGRIGFEGRFDCAAIGTSGNLAARLCEVADDRQIIVTDDIARSLKEFIPTLKLGALNLKGFRRQVPVSEIPASF